jgi:hypothetical protein
MQKYKININYRLCIINFLVTLHFKLGKNEISADYTNSFCDVDACYGISTDRLPVGIAYGNLHR